jgi:hypothetical protein
MVSISGSRIEFAETAKTALISPSIDDENGQRLLRVVLPFDVDGNPDGHVLGTVVTDARSDAWTLLHLYQGDRVRRWKSGMSLPVHHRVRVDGPSPAGEDPLVVEGVARWTERGHPVANRLAASAPLEAELVAVLRFPEGSSVAIRLGIGSGTWFLGHDFSVLPDAPDGNAADALDDFGDPGGQRSGRPPVFSTGQHRGRIGNLCVARHVTPQSSG